MNNNFEQSMWMNYPTIKQEIQPTSEDFSYYTQNNLCNFHEFDSFDLATVDDSIPTISFDGDMSLSRTPSPHQEQNWHFHSEVASSRGGSDTESSSGKSQKTPDQRRQRRREQNRQSQRLYRARKESLLKEYADRITKLEAELQTCKSDNGRLTAQLLQVSRQHEAKRLHATKDVKTSYFSAPSNLSLSELDGFA